MSPYWCFLTLLAVLAEAQSIDLTQYVLTTTGDTGGGNTFPGVALPFGMVKLGPDLYTGSDSYSGFAPNGNFTGFSMMHESGTGGAPKYGVVSQMPALGKDLVNPMPPLNDTRSQPDNTSVGYYKSSLGSGITVELSATARAGIYQYTFPDGADANIVVDVSHVLPSFRGQGLSQAYVSGNMTTVEDHYEGFGEYNNGWNRAPTWRIYFCGYFDSPHNATILKSQTPEDTSLTQYPTETSAASTNRVGALFSFNKFTNVTSRVGVSFISSAQACSNVNTQIPLGTNLSTVVSSAKKTWNEQVLSKVTTTSTDTSNLELLYSSMYFMHLLPSNRTGENPLWTSAEPYYDDTFTTWDLFRCTFALIHIFQPVMYSEYVRSLIDIFRFDGYMPDARSLNFNGASQGGSNSDNILADAYVKGVRGDVNWTAGYEAMLKDAEVTPTNNNDPRDLSSSTKEGRGALPDWHTYGYITPTYGRAVTRAIEYAVNDFSLSQVATGLNKPVDVEKYIHRSRNWRNHWNPAATALNHSGFLVPRTVKGFVDQNPLSCGGCYWGDAFYEALPWEYSMNAHHDINTLIALSGGPDKFEARLDATFKADNNPNPNQFNNTIFNPGNEPSFTTPYLYNFVGKQEKAVQTSRNIAKQYYKPTPDGLPGNSDAGAMESWVLWNMLGLYPLVGQSTFLIGSPWFNDTTLTLSSTTSLRITTSGGSEDAFCVQSLKVNGKEWDQNWLTYDDIFANGGSMEFTLGSEPKTWATGALPPSPASEFSTTTSPQVILSPGNVPSAPSVLQEKTNQNNKRRAGVIAAICVGSIVGVAAVSFLVWWFLFRKKQSKAVNGESTTSIPDTTKPPNESQEDKN